MGFTLPSMAKKILFFRGQQCHIFSRRAPPIQWSFDWEVAEDNIQQGHVYSSMEVLSSAPMWTTHFKHMLLPTHCIIMLQKEEDFVCLHSLQSNLWAIAGLSALKTGRDPAIPDSLQGKSPESAKYPPCKAWIESLTSTNERRDSHVAQPLHEEGTLDQGYVCNLQHMQGEASAGAAFSWRPHVVDSTKV